MYPKRGPEPRLLHSSPLSVLKEFRSRKKRSVPRADNRDDNGGAVGHSVASLPLNTCTLSALGVGGEFSSLDGVQEARELRKEDCREWSQLRRHKLMGAGA